MSVETRIYTGQPAMSGSWLRELAGRQGLELRFLDFDGMPLGPDVQLDESMLGKNYVLIGWPTADAETTGAVESALREGSKSEVDRLGMAGKLGWCSIGCSEFDFAEFEALLSEGREQDGDDEEEPVDDDFLRKMSGARTEYSFRCGTRPRQCADLLGKVAALVRDATDGFTDE